MRYMTRAAMNTTARAAAARNGAGRKVMLDREEQFQALARAHLEGGEAFLGVGPVTGGRLHPEGPVGKGCGHLAAFFPVGAALVGDVELRGGHAFDAAHQFVGVFGGALGFHVCLFEDFSGDGGLVHEHADVGVGGFLLQGARINDDLHSVAGSIGGGGCRGAGSGCWRGCRLRGSGLGCRRGTGGEGKQETGGGE